jgi:sugar phosphate isomerase/epimerase
MKYGISTICLESETAVTDNLQIPAEAGISIIELNADNYQSFPLEDPAFMPSLTQKIQQLRLTVNSIHSPIHNSISDPDPAARSRAVNDIINTMEKCLPLADGTENPIRIIVHPGHHLSRTPGHIQFGHCIESLRAVLNAPVTARYRICIENMLSSHFGGKPEDIVSLITQLPAGTAGVCLDTSHSVYDSSPEVFLEAVFPYLETTHLSDNFHQSAGEYHAIPMTIRHSRIDWKKLMNRLEQKLDTIIFELIRPPLLDMDIFTRMFKCSIEQIERWNHHTGA